MSFKLVSFFTYIINNAVKRVVKKTIPVMLSLALVVDLNESHALTLTKPRWSWP